MTVIIRSIKTNLMNQKGGVLIYTFIIFSVVFILSISVISIFSSNLFQAKRQENYMEAYYLSYSGSLMAYAAVTDNSSELLEKIHTNNHKYNESNINLGKGTITVKAEKSTNTDYLGWIEIVSVGTLTNEKTSAKTTLYIDPLDPNNFKWNAF